MVCRSSGQEHWDWLGTSWGQGVFGLKKKKVAHISPAKQTTLPTVMGVCFLAKMGRTPDCRCDRDEAVR